MADILEKIVAFKKQEVENYKKELKLDTLVERTEILEGSQKVSLLSSSANPPLKDGSTRMQTPVSYLSVMKGMAQAH